MNTTWHGTPILTRTRPHIESHGLLIVGDAAQYGEPFTGEGMTWALRGGQMVAAHALSIAKGAYRKGDWTREWQTTIAPRIRRSMVLSRSLRWPRTLHVAIEVAHLNRGLLASLARLAGPWGDHDHTKRGDSVQNVVEELVQ